MGRREGPPLEDEEEEACLEGVQWHSGQRAWIWPGEDLKQVGHLYKEQLTRMCLSFLHWKQVSWYRGWSRGREASWLLPVHQMSVRSKAISSSLVKGDDEVEGVEFLEVAAASSMRF